MPRPLVGVDVDGVVGAFSPYALSLFNAAHGTSWCYDDIKTWDWGTTLGPEAENFCWKIVNEGTCFAEMEPFEGAANAIDELHEVADVLFVTAMPAKHYQKRFDWLGRHGFPQNLVIKNSKEKPVYAMERGLAAFIEDKEETAEMVAILGIPSFLVNRASNVDFYSPRLAGRGTLEEVVRMIARLPSIDRA